MSRHRPAADSPSTRAAPVAPAGTGPAPSTRRALRATSPPSASACSSSARSAGAAERLPALALPAPPAGRHTWASSPATVAAPAPRSRSSSASEPNGKGPVDGVHGAFRVPCTGG